MVPSLPLKSQPRSRLAQAFTPQSCSICLCYFWGTSTPLKSREQKGERERKREREREREGGRELAIPSKGSLLPHLALNPPHPRTSDCALCSAVLLSKISLAAAQGANKDCFFFRAMETRPDSFRPGRWSGFLTGSDSYWFK
jgi:hypothetical protein